MTQLRLVGDEPSKRYPRMHYYYVENAALQPGMQVIRCVLPIRRPDGLLLAIPPTAGLQNSSTHLGDPLAIVRKLGYMERERVAVCTPSFAHVPWLAERDSNARPSDIDYNGQPVLRQQTYARWCDFCGRASNCCLRRAARSSASAKRAGR